MAKYRMLEDVNLNGIVHSKGAEIELDSKIAGLTSLKSRIEYINPRNPVTAVNPAPQTEAQKIQTPVEKTPESKLEPEILKTPDKKEEPQIPGNPPTENTPPNDNIPPFM